MVVILDTFITLNGNSAMNPYDLIALMGTIVTGSVKLYN